jgi:diguanylate cyclase (GGDEF)-like protein/PAS domain S-box-containing protein
VLNAEKGGGTEKAAGPRFSRPRSQPARRRWGLRRLSVTMLVLGLGLATVSFALAQRAVASSERALLGERTSQAARVLSAIAATEQSALQAVAGTAAAGDAAVAASLAATPSVQLAAVAVLRSDGSGHTSVVATAGPIHAPLPSAGDVATGVLKRALGAKGFQVVGFVGRGSDRVVGIGLGAPYAPAGVTVYGELPLPESVALTPPSSGDVFKGIEFGLYLDGSEQAGALLFSNVTDLPIRGSRATVIIGPTLNQNGAPVFDAPPGAVKVAPGDLLVVVAPSAPLVGALVADLPWLVLAAALLSTLVLVGGLEGSLRRRDRALGLVADLDQAIAAEQRTSQALIQSERGFRLLFDSNPHSMWAYDIDTRRFLAVNDAAVGHYGYTREEFLEMTIDDLRQSDDLMDGRSTGEQRVPASALDVPRHRIKDGRVIEVAITSHEQEFSGHHAVFVLAQDVTDRRLLEEQLRHQAFHDPLTHLANRALFLDRVAHALARAQRDPQRTCAVMLLDLDDFKTVNDSRGHATGDSLLTAVAERLRGAVRPTDTAARLGGDEFAVLLEDVRGIDGPLLAADRILDAMRRPFTIDGIDHFVSVSIGIAVAPDAGRSAETMLSNADIAMYRAKEQGKARRSMYQPSMHAALVDRIALENELRVATREGQLCLVYQPQIELRSGRIVAVEALLRWDHPTRGRIAPDNFIALAEETRLIIDIDAWVLRTACQQAMAWRNAGLDPLRVAVNVSGHDLVDAGLSERILQTLHETGLPADALEIELTEGAAVRQPAEALATLREIRAHGVRVAVDDFGTGYSVLGRLREFPTDGVKIDRAFIQEITSRGQAAPLVEAMIVMGHSLGLEVVAEGVETAEQLALLVEKGCDHAQGYLLSMPLEPADVANMLRNPASRQTLESLVARDDDAVLARQRRSTSAAAS